MNLGITPITFPLFLSAESASAPIIPYNELDSSVASYSSSTTILNSYLVLCKNCTFEISRYKLTIYQV